MGSFFSMIFVGFNFPNEFSPKSKDTVFENVHESSTDDDTDNDVIVYPDIIGINNFEKFFIMKKGKSPSNIDWNLFHEYDTNNKQQILFEDFMEIVENGNHESHDKNLFLC